MSTAQWILNATLLVWVLTRNLGTRRVNASTFWIPLVVVAAAGSWLLDDLPTSGHDPVLEVIGAGVGVILGLVGAASTRMSHRGGDLVVHAGAGFAGLWIAAIGGRALFAQWATHSGARALGEFSIRHQITGADAWTAAFVLMALAMVSARLTVLAVQVRSHRSRTPEWVEAGAA